MKEYMSKGRIEEVKQLEKLAKDAEGCRTIIGNETGDEDRVSFDVTEWFSSMTVEQADFIQLWWETEGERNWALLYRCLSLEP